MQRLINRTKTGRVLTDAEIEAMADEAERGYDIEVLKTRRRDPRPPAQSGRQSEEQPYHR